MTNQRPLVGQAVVQRVDDLERERPRIRVYLSSTYADLVEFRRRVDETLRTRRYEVVGMETYAAADERPVDRCLLDARECDFYVGIFAWRYGFIPPGYDRSITELEYQAAREAGRDCLIFLLTEDADWPRNQVERGRGEQQIESLRAELKVRHVVGWFTTPDDLATKVLTAITQEAEEHLLREVEALRANQAAQGARSPDPQRVVNLPPLDVSRFVDRDDEQAELRAYVADPAVRIVAVLGRPGMGKSALASRVLSAFESGRASSNATPPAGDVSPVDGLLYLSAHDTGMSLERVFAGMRRMLPLAEAETLDAEWSSRDATVEQKVDMLLGAMRGRRYLVLLDAMEGVLTEDAGIAEPGLRAFVLGCLHRRGAPVLVITSRIDVVVPPEALGSVRSVSLRSGLATGDAVALLRELDPQGQLGLRDAPLSDLERAAQLTSGIPRALELLAGILSGDPSANLGALVAHEGGPGVEVVASLVAEGYRRLTGDERRVMHALAVLGQPATPTAISYLLHPWYPGIDVRACLRRLTMSYFVLASRATGEFSLQPVDREHSYRQIPAPDAAVTGDEAKYDQRSLELRAADFFASIRKPQAAWLSIEDVAPQIAEFQHRVRGQDVDHALEVLQEIDRDYLALWGHFTRLIELRNCVLDKPARPDLRAANFAGLATGYQVLGEYDAAVRYFQQAVDIAQAEDDRGAALEYIGDLGRVYRNLGKLDNAVQCLRQTLDFAREQSNRRKVGIWSDRLALCEWHLGRLGESTALGQQAVALARDEGDRVTEAAALANLGLVYQTHGQDVLAQTTFARALAIMVEIGDRRGQTILLGRLGTAALALGDPVRALELHDEAQAIAQALGERREQSYQHLGRGRALAEQGRLDEAEQSLRAAKALEVPETSYLAALALSLVVVHSGDWIACAAAFEESVRRCRERLDRCDRLYQARYALATSLIGGACTAPAWREESRHGELLAVPITEYERALANCASPGPVRAALCDLASLTSAGVVGLEPVTMLLQQALDVSQDAGVTVNSVE
jgi:tetratricopeptide (TPR) repeat protein